MGYGAVTLAVMFACVCGVPALLPRLFNESTWTVGRQIGMMLLTIFFVTIGNFLYSGTYLRADFSVRIMLYFGVITTAIGIFPLTVLVLYRQLKWQRQYNREAALINMHVQEKKQQEPEQPAPTSGNQIRIAADQAKDDLTLAADQLTCIEAADNYIRVFYESEGAMKQVLLRGTLKKAVESLNSHPFFFRCHRTYLVNLDKVEQISGNAAGYKLQLKLLPMEIPVSRNLHRELTERLR